MRGRHLLFALAIALFAFAACGDDDNSAKTQACDARSDLSSSVNKVVDDIKNGNFGQAKDDLAGVQQAASNLQSATQNLGQEQKSEVQPEVDQLQSTLQSLSSVSSLTELQSTWDSAKSSIDQITSSVSDSLDC